MPEEPRTRYTREKVLTPTDQLYAFLGDIYVTGPSEHTADQFHIVGEAVLGHANIHVHHGKTHSTAEEAPGLLAALLQERPSTLQLRARILEVVSPRSV
eukprot:s548_g26.t1